MKNNLHKNSKRTYYEIADADWGMFHSETFKTEQEAREAIKSEYKNHTNEYWRNRKQIVIKITVEKTVLD